MTNRIDLYTRVTNAIIADLEQGVRPWLKPWNSEHAAGRITRPLRAGGQPYKGINVLMLWASAMNQNFAAERRLLLKKPHAPKNWQFLSISFDPANDTPGRLASYAPAADYDKSHWSFLTGEEGQISGLAEQIGENYWHEGASLAHNLRTVVVDPTGRIRNIIPGSKWTVEDFVEDMVQAGR